MPKSNPKPRRQAVEELAVCAAITVIAAIGWVLILAPTDPSLWLILVSGGLVVLVALYVSEAWTSWRARHARPVSMRAEKEARR